MQAARTADRLVDLVEREHPKLSVREQCDLLGVSRSSAYYEAVGPSEAEMRLRRILDELYMKDPCLGSRRLVSVLARDYGITINRKGLQRVRREMGHEAIYCRPRTSLPGAGHRIFPYLLREVEVGAPNEVWCSDITYVPMERGHAYLCVVMDWYSRKVLGWELSNTMDVGLCLAALQATYENEGCAPGMMNTDQGSQFTSEPWLQALLSRGVRVSMDGRGRWMDNVFIERLWRSVKYEEIYINGCVNIENQKTALERWFARYNEWRPHQALDNQTPAAVHAESRQKGEEKIIEKRVA
jgi:putative transposase